MIHTEVLFYLNLFLLTSVILSLSKNLGKHKMKDYRYLLSSARPDPSSHSLVRDDKTLLLNS